MTYLTHTAPVDIVRAGSTPADRNSFFLTNNPKALLLSGRIHASNTIFVPSDEATTGSEIVGHSLAVTHSLSFSFSLAHSHSHSHSLTLTRSLSLAHSHSLTFVLTHSLTRTHSHTLTLTLTLTLSLILTYPHSFSRTLTLTLLSLTRHSPLPRHCARLHSKKLHHTTLRNTA